MLEEPLAGGDGPVGSAKVLYYGRAKVDLATLGSIQSAFCYRQHHCL